MGTQRGYRIDQQNIERVLFTDRCWPRKTKTNPASPALCAAAGVKSMPTDG